MSYSDAYKAEAVAIARRLGNPTLAELARALPLNDDGKRPTRNALERWIVDAGVNIRRYDANEQWTDEIRDQAVRLVRVDGLTPASASQHIRRKLGRSPRESMIARWIDMAPVAIDEAGDDGPDIWQQAWDAGDGLDGAAWAEAVMRAWLPPATFEPAPGKCKEIPYKLSKMAA